MTLDELIDRLTKFRDLYGGDIPVLVTSEHMGNVKLDDSDVMVWNHPFTGNEVIINAPIGA